jgi:membrane-bound serine protease (ClpP class)
MTATWTFGELPWPALALSTSGWIGLVVVLMVAGLVFLGAEIFVIPGFGIAGVVGLASLVAGVVLGWIQLGAFWGFTLLLVSGVATVAALWVVFKTDAGQKLMLGDSLTNTVAVNDEGSALLHAEGVAVTNLRPSGSADFGDARLQVETEGEFVPRGSKVRVVAVVMGRVVVEAVDEADPGPAAAGQPEQQGTT